MTLGALEPVRLCRLASDEGWPTWNWHRWPHLALACPTSHSESHEMKQISVLALRLPPRTYADPQRHVVWAERPPSLLIPGAARGVRLLRTPRRATWAHRHSPQSFLAERVGGTGCLFTL